MYSLYTEQMLSKCTSLKILESRDEKEEIKHWIWVIAYVVSSEINRKQWYVKLTELEYKLRLALAHT